MTDRVKQLVDELAEKLHQYTSKVTKVQDYLAEKQKAEQSARKDVKREQYTRGDWCLVSIAHKRKSKLVQRWIGPYQIVRSNSPFTYTVINPIRNKQTTVHVRRLRFYSHKWLLKEEEIKQSLKRQHEFFSVSKILQIKEHEGEKKCLVEWKNIQEESWLPVEEVAEIAAKKLRKYLEKQPAD